MKCISITLLAALAASCAAVNAQSNHAHADASSSAEQFAAIQSLVGDWEGAAGESGDPTPKFRYESTAGGSAIIEHLFVGTPDEMVTVYHRDGPRLVLTHYCKAGNQPRMVAMPASSAAPMKIVFEFDGGTNLDPAVGMHMHAASLSIDGRNHLVESWTAYTDGKPDHSAQFDLHRVASAR